MITNQQLLNMSDADFMEAAKEEFKDLPRAQRRQKERELMENVKIMSQFTPKQMVLIEDVIRYGVKERVNEKIEMIGFIADMATSSYLIESNENITLDEVTKIQEIITEEFAVSYEKYSKIINSCKGDLNMAKKKFEKYEEEVKKVSEELLEDGVKQAEAIVILQDKFPTLSKAMLVNGFKKVKAEREVKEVDREIVQAAEYIFPEIKEEKKDKQEPQKQATEEKKEVSNVITPVKEEKPTEVKESGNKLIPEVISKDVVVRCGNNEYKVTLDGVQAQGKLYKTEKDVDSDLIRSIEMANEGIADCERQIARYKNSISNIQSISEEIKAVMTMA